MRANGAARTMWRMRKPIFTAMLAIALGLPVMGAAHSSESRIDAGPVEAKAPICFVPADDPAHEENRTVDRSAVPEILRTSLSYRGPCAAYGPYGIPPMGDLSPRAYTQVDGHRPLAIGVRFPAATLDLLPDRPSDEQQCHDLNGDGTSDPATECAPGHRHPLELPAGFAASVDTPFTHAVSSWYPQGTRPRGVYDVAYLDFHFFTAPPDERTAIGPGPCPGVVDCAAYARARKPVPARYLPRGFADLGLVEPAIGNGLPDIGAPEFHGRPLTHGWLYGAYDGRITYDDVRVAMREFAAQRAGTAGAVNVPIKAPRAHVARGWYPTRYRVEYRANRRDFTVSITDFVYREAG
jgi:hypothetical protein